MYSASAAAETKEVRHRALESPPMADHATPTEDTSGRSRAWRLTRILVAALLLAAAVTAVLRLESPSKPVPAAIASRRAKTLLPSGTAAAPSRQRAAAMSDDEAKQLLIGVWADDYQGQRTLTVRPDGTATMVVQFDGWKARLFTPRLQIETSWTVDAGRFNRQTVGGEPADKVEFVKNRVGDRASDRIVKVTADRMLLVDQDGETQYDWRRLR
jgi:hypothetical protein